MTQELKAVNSIFYFTGISLKSFKTKRSCNENIFCVCSFTLFAFHWIASGASLFIHRPVANTIPVVVFLHILFVSICISCFSTLLSTIRFINHEKEFWKLSEELTSLFDDHLGMKMNFKRFSKRATVKIYFSLVVFVACQVFVIVTAKAYGDKTSADAAIAMLFPVTVLRISAIKFVFFVDISNFHLTQIKVKLTEKHVTLHNMKTLMKAYALCWRLCVLIEEIFSRGLIFNTLLTFIGALFSGYNVCVGITTNTLHIGPFYTVVSIIFISAIVVNACTKCVNSSRKIASLVFTKSSKKFHRIIEAFALQILHQRIAFEPKGLFAVNYKYLMSVSLIENYLERDLFYFFTGRRFNRFLQRNFTAVLLDVIVLKRN